MTADERRRIGAVVEAAERARSLPELLEITLAALDEHLGFSRSAFMLAVADPPFPGNRAYAGVMHGWPPCVLEEYFERWADRDPLGSEAARAAFARGGRATIAEVYPRLDRGRRRFVDDFMRRTRTIVQVSHRLPAAWTDAYVTLMGSDEPTGRDDAVVARVLPELAEVLRAYLPRGLDAGLSRREAQATELATLALSNREIAAVLHVEEDTVKKHVSHAMAKVGVHTRTALAVAWATGRRMDPQTTRGGA